MGAGLLRQSGHSTHDDNNDVDDVDDVGGGGDDNDDNEGSDDYGGGNDNKNDYDGGGGSGCSGYQFKPIVQIIQNSLISQKLLVCPSFLNKRIVNHSVVRGVGQDLACLT